MRSAIVRDLQVGACVVWSEWVADSRGIGVFPEESMRCKHSLSVAEVDQLRAVGAVVRRKRDDERQDGAPLPTLEAQPLSFSSA